MVDERDRLSRLNKLEADAKALAAEQVKSRSANEEKVKAAKKESELMRAEQLKTQREARALAERLGAKVDSTTGLIDSKTVTTPFGVYGSKGAKTVDSRSYRGSGKNRVLVIRYVDGTEDITAAPELSGDDGSGNDGSGNDNIGTGTTYTAPDGRIFTNLAAYNAYIAQTAAEEKRRAGQSAYDLLFSEFDRYGLGALIEPLKGFIQDGLSEAELTLRLRDTDAYKKRFAANQARIKSGLRALSEAEYIGLEDQYQDVMRRYGLPESYYTRGDMGRQEGFEKFIGGDVSPVELEDRIQTAQTRVVNANPEVSKALREFYPEITGGDILAYALDPAQAITNIKRKVGAAEIGAGAMQAGLQTGLARAEELQRYGVTKETAQQGFGTISSGLERGRQLSNIYQQPDYTQQVAETEVFALPDADKARRQRRRLGQLETATFSGSTGMTGGALDRERAGQY
jgi:hypothetical protein